MNITICGDERHTLSYMSLTRFECETEAFFRPKMTSTSNRVVVGSERCEVAKLCGCVGVA